jgi:hypothetical protein
MRLGRGCRCLWLRCDYVAIPTVADSCAGGGIVGALSGCAICVESGGGAATALASGEAGSQTVQQQALRDFAQSMCNFLAGTHRRPTWRKAGVHEGFRQVGVKSHHIELLNRHFGRVWVPKVGWLRFHLSRPVPAGVRSYRVTRDRAGRWHVAFAHIPIRLPGRATAASSASTAASPSRPHCPRANCCMHQVLPRERRSGWQFCNSGSHAASGGPTVAKGRNGRSRNLELARVIGAKTGSRKPPLTLRGAWT